ncbi:MAG: nitroreductase family protein [Acidimicrobiales bacterium]
MPHHHGEWNTAQMDAIAALRNKRDQRDYTDEPIADDLLDTVLDAARMAGSAKNQQPVRLVVVTDPATKEALKAGGDFAADRPAARARGVHRAGRRRTPLFDVGRHAQNLMVAATALGCRRARSPSTTRPSCAILGIPDDVDAPMVVSLDIRPRAAARHRSPGPGCRSVTMSTVDVGPTDVGDRRRSRARAHAPAVAPAAAGGRSDRRVGRDRVLRLEDR